MEFAQEIDIGVDLGDAPQPDVAPPAASPIVIDVIESEHEPMEQDPVPEPIQENPVHEPMQQDLVPVPVHEDANVGPVINFESEINEFQQLVNEYMNEEIFGTELDELRALVDRHEREVIVDTFPPDLD